MPLVEKKERGRPSLAVLALQNQPLGSILEIDEHFGTDVNSDILNSEIVDSGNHDFLNISSLSAFAQPQSNETDLNQGFSQAFQGFSRISRKSSRYYCTRQFSSHICSTRPG